VRGSQAAQLVSGADMNVPLQEGGAYAMHLEHSVANHELSCTTSSPALDQPYQTSGSDTRYTSGFVALRSQFVAMHVDFIVVYANP